MSFISGEPAIIKKLDYYIARNFLVPFLIITGAALGLYIAAEALRDLDEYLRASETLVKTIGRMGLAYLVRAPVFLTPLVPMTILVAGAFSIAYMARNNEITAMKASGISLHRILMPVFLSATFVSILGFLNQEIVVPFVELRFQPILKSWIGEEAKYEEVGRYIIEENTMYIGNFNIVNQIMLEPHVYLNTSGEIVHIDAKWGRYTGDGWILYEEVNIDGRKAREDEYFWSTSLTPEKLASEVLPRSSKPLPVILNHIRSKTASPGYSVMLYSRISYPLVGVALLLVGIPFMLGHEEIRRSRLFGVGLCILVGGIYYTLAFLCNSLGEVGTLHPAVAGFLPVTLLGAVGIYLSDRIRS